MQIAFEGFLFAAVGAVIINYIIGLFQEYRPEILPPILRKKVIELKTFEMIIIYNGPFGMKTYKDSIEGNSIHRVEEAVLDELNKKKFISLNKGGIIPTNSIKFIEFKEETGE